MAAFERNVPVPTNPKYSRQYDLSYDIGGGRFLDVDVKKWTSFDPALVRSGEAWKLQKDIVIKFLNEGTFDNLKWAIPKDLYNAPGARQAIESWMLSQFKSSVVLQSLDSVQIRDGRAAFSIALKKGLLDFFD